jgi:hypothetical protein
MAMARAKHIVRRTITFSLALSPSNPNSGTTSPFPLESSRQDTVEPTDRPGGLFPA